MPLGKEIPIERGHQRGVPPLEIVILPQLARLAWERLQIDTDLLLTITSFPVVPTSMTLNDLEPQNRVFSEFFAILGCDAHLEWIFAEITGDRPRQLAYDIKLMLSRVSWALAHISCFLSSRAWSTLIRFSTEKAQISVTFEYWIFPLFISEVYLWN